MKKQLLNVGVAIVATILLAGTALAQHEAPVRVETLPFAASGDLVMDGIADEGDWSDALGDWEMFNSSGVTDDQDFSGTIRLCYDLENIYFFADVVDDIETSWDGTGDDYTFDNVEIFLDFDTTITNADGAYIGDEIQLRYNRGDVNDSVGGNQERNGADMSNYAILSSGAGWTVEAAIPWIAFMEEGKSNQDMIDWIEAGNVIGFDASYADNDGDGRDGQMAWDADEVGAGTTEDNAWKDTRVFGVLEFEVVNSVNSPSSSSFSVYPNPATNVVNFNNLTNVNSIEIVNLVGQIVKVVDVAGNNVVVNVADLASGNYFAKVNSASGVETVKFIVK